MPTNPDRATRQPLVSPVCIQFYASLWPLGAAHVDVVGLVCDREPGLRSMIVSRGGGYVMDWGNRFVFS